MNVRTVTGFAAATIVLAISSFFGGAANAASPHVVLPTCTAANLTVQIGASNGTAGTIYYDLRLSNKSAQKCTLHGIPRAQAVFGPAHRPIGPKSTSNKLGGRGALVAIIAHGGVANAQWGVVEAGNFTPSTCLQKNANGVVVTAGSTSYYFKLPTIAVCTKRASTTISGFALGL